MKLFLKRLVQLGGFLVIVLVLAYTVLHWYRPSVQFVAPPAPKPISGAAVFYYQAFAAMPEMIEEEKKLVNFKQPLDVNAAKKFLAKCDASLRLIAQGVRQPECEWGVNVSVWPENPLTHLTKGLKIGQVLGVRARLHLLDGEVSSATDDLLLLFRFARHLGQNGLIVDNLVMISCNAIALNLAARQLQDFDPTSLQKLSAGMASLPPSHTMREGVEMESKTFAVYMRNLLARQYAKGRKNAPSNPVEDVKMDTPVATQAVIGDNSAAFLTMNASPSFYLMTVRRLESDSQELEKLMEVPFPEGRPKIDAFIKKIQRREVWNWSRIWSILMLPASAATRYKEVQIEMLWTIFRTALNAQLHNPGNVRQELSKLRDPYDGQPIAMRDVEGGVEIQLKSDPGKKSVTLTVGLAGK